MNSFNEPRKMLLLLLLSTFSVFNFKIFFSISFYLKKKIISFVNFIIFISGFLGSFLSNSLKTTQLEVNTDAKTLRPVARLKEPRDLFALPKERDHECPQQAARWPIECQVSKFIL